MNSRKHIHRRWLLARTAILASVLWLMPAPQLRAIIADPRPFDYIQPDGTKATLYLRGDEFFHWHEDTNGFTALQTNRTFVYATLDSQNHLVPTDLLVGPTDPLAKGLTAHTLPPSQLRPLNSNNELRPYLPWKAKQAGTTEKNLIAQGTVKNLVILCKFSDHTFGVHTRIQGDYNVLFNQVGGDPILAPTGSVKDAYLENSYGIVTIQSTVLAWVTLPQTQAYYAGTNNGLGGDYPNNAKKMVQDALALVDPLVDFSQFDTDNDGYIDAIDIIHSGYGAESAGAAANTIWSHKGSLPADWVSADNNANGVKVKVNTYHTEAALWGTSGTGITHIGVICHETGHFFGLPDLYDTDYSSKGVAEWCLMANSWGFDGDQLHPPHFSAWCKVFLTWTSPYEPTTSGNYFLSQAETWSHAAKFTRGFPAGEYLLVENRQPVGLDARIPQGGLAIWHIDETVGGNTTEGFPGQAGWPGNGAHFKVALLQADGLYELERNVTNGNAGDLYRGSEQTLGLATTPNTSTYQGGIITPTFNIFSQFTASGTSMGFFFSRGLYVDKFYSGTITDGNFPTPYRRVIDAYNAAQAGDTIVMRGTDYFEAPLNNLTNSVNFDCWLGAASIR